MEILISNKIYINNPPQTLKNAIKEALTLRNPAYDAMYRKHGKRVRYMNIKENFEYFEEKDDMLIVGRGCENRIKKFCQMKNIDIDIAYDLTFSKLDIDFHTKKIIPRENQVGVLDPIIGNSVAIAKLGTGFGKTIIAMKLIEKVQQKTLVIVPDCDNFNRFVSKIKEFYDYDCGQIQGSVWNIKDITIASIATLIKRDLSEIKNYFGMVIIDEIQKMLSEPRVNAIQSFNPTYQYGMTATPRRSDGQTDALFTIYGDIAIERKNEQIKPEVHVVKNTENFINFNFDKNRVRKPPTDYCKMVTEMIENEQRNNLILGIVNNEIRGGRKVLILTKRVEHSTILENKFPQEIITYKISSSTNTKERTKLLDGLGDGSIKFDVVLGTYQMLATGVDIPSLDTLVFAGDIKSDVLTEQSIGRILRIFKDKNKPKIIDIDDSMNGMFHRQHLERMKLYRKEGWEIIKN